MYNLILNPFLTWVARINAKECKLTTILELFNALVPYFMTFNFHVLCIISEKRAGPYFACVTILTLTLTLIVKNLRMFVSRMILYN